ncbi:DUF262 domain-containing protein [Changpingibacter yushuensis]|uniref:DUF262 domain-containing protein n=1 Tax=Changpingibacter yushuensis TaxID=2758440 RepID=UPI00165E7F24|nr:DUF262 domain-containing protein [Changpingibacter yushuensis]
MNRIESFTSFTQMFERGQAQGDVITRVEIPLIQRDYAQGRGGERVEEIRQNFLHVLHGAVATPDAEPVGLDFVYGELDSEGILYPLDGQQRLTTLFLLHWYLASRSGNLNIDAGWTHFSYETRPSARRFCQRLIRATPPLTVDHLAAWVQEQPWYLFVWRHDPTISSMLVMIDAIHKQFSGVDAAAAWCRLTDTARPAIGFHLLPLPDMGSAEDLYVKMNSRGKPLTEFENFKARLEKTIEWSPRATEFADKIDKEWLDVLWMLRGDDNTVDDAFLRYFEFLIEVCEWRDDALCSGIGSSIITRATRVLDGENPRAPEHLDFLFTALDIWVNRDVAGTFEEFFGQSGLPLFFRAGTRSKSNLFESCCRSYGEVIGSNRRTFTLGQTLLLLAVITHLSEETVDFEARVRTLRNLIEGSQSEIRADRMPRLVADAVALITKGTLPEPGSTFAAAQISDEEDKRIFLSALKDEERDDAVAILHRLEDNTLLKGTTSAFYLDSPNGLAMRVEAFSAIMTTPELWPNFTATLLTFGDYQWPSGRAGKLDDSDRFQFGTGDKQAEDAWRQVLVGRDRTDIANTADALCACLDAVAASSEPLEKTLSDLSTAWLSKQETNNTFDWRYYFVKYPAMRLGTSGLYYAEKRQMGFGLTNLPRGKSQRNAYHFDPYLSSIHYAAGEPEGVESLALFSGYESNPRWLRLTRSQVGLRSIPEGFQIDRPAEEECDKRFTASVASLGISITDVDDPQYIFRIPKTTDDASGPDAIDRIVVGAKLLNNLLAAGF